MDRIRIVALAFFLMLVATACGSYDSRQLQRSMPHYPGARLVSSTHGCGRGTTTGTVCGSETIWRMRSATPEEAVNAWFGRHLPGWTYSSCGTGYTKGHAFATIATSGRTLSVYVDAHGADHCNDVPAG